MVRNAVPASGEEHRSDLVEVGTLPTNKQNEGVQRKTHRRRKPRPLQQRLGKLRPEARLREARASPRGLLMWGNEFCPGDRKSLKDLKQGNDLLCVFVKLVKWKYEV